MLLGAHVSVSGGIHTAIDRIEEMGGEAVQVFTQSPRMWRPTHHDPANFERFKERRAEAGIGAVACHALYLINLASPKDDFYSKSVEALRNTVDVGCAIEADAVVFHVGSHLGSGFEAGLERVVPALAEALERCNEKTWLCMENTAGTGDTIGRSLEELAALEVAPERTLFVGDRLYEDVRGAGELGMTTVQALWFRADEHPDGGEPDYQAFTQLDVLNIARRLVLA